MAFENSLGCCNVTEKDIKDLEYIYGLEPGGCYKFMKVCRIGASLSGGQAAVFVGVDSTGCLVRDVVHVEQPLSGNGTIANPIRFNYNLSALIDACNLGGSLSQATTVKDYVVRDANGCLTYSDARTAAKASETPISFLTSQTISPVVSGTNNHTFSANVILAPQQSGVANQLTATTSGLYVPTGAGLTPTDTKTIDHTFIQSTGILTSDVKVSTLPGNQIIISADGLFVPANGGGNTTETALTVIDTATVDMVAGVAGAGHTGLQANVKVSASNGNILTANADGLFVPSPASISETPLTVGDTASVNLTSVGTSGHTLTADVKISLSPSNVAVINPDGIYVPAPTYPDSGHDDVGTPCNVLSTTITGQLQSHRIADVASDRRTFRRTPNDTALVPASDRVIIATQASIGITLATPSACDPLIYSIKNKSVGIIRVLAQAGATIEGLAFIELDGVVVGGYSFQNNGGESVELGWDAASNEWIVL